MYEIHLDVYCQFMYVYFTRFSSMGFYRKCFLHVFLTLRLMPLEVELMLMCLTIPQDVCRCDRNEMYEIQDYDA